MINLFYKKNDNKKLFNQLNNLENNNIYSIQNYIPIYDNFFSINQKNWNSFNLNHEYQIQEIKEQHNHNTFSIVIQKDNKCETVDSFFKFSPLLDPIKYMGGKYRDISKETILTLPKYGKTHEFDKYTDPNNIAYVDSFFSFLSCKLREKYNFIHGIQFYGSFIGIQNNFICDISDDIEYLENSKLFYQNQGSLFDIDSNYGCDSYYQTRKYKNPLKIHETAKISVIDPSFDTSLNEIFIADNTKTKNATLKTYYKNSLTKRSYQSSSDSNEDTSNSSDSDSHSDSDSNSEQEKSSDINDNNESDTEYDSDQESELEVNSTIFKIPVHIICSEKLEHTLDDYINRNDKFIPLTEWKSILFQVIMILITYQKVFNFTHNDLHTNNIMYSETNNEFLYYKYNNKVYKVPTFGKLYKIIDFGRSIYNYKDKEICSDNYKKGEDAYTQYNFGVYCNKNKPELKPNHAFDLCRLSCSLIDYFIDDYEEIDKIEKNEIIDLILEWCQDDNGKNILYKPNGRERFKGFKLYKMIARITHHQTPQKQVSKNLFNDYITENITTSNLIDIDAMEREYY